MPREGVGVALGAQVRHVVTNHVSPEGPVSKLEVKYLRRLAEVASPLGISQGGGQIFDL